MKSITGSLRYLSGTVTTPTTGGIPTTGGSNQNCTLPPDIFISPIKINLLVLHQQRLPWRFLSP
jgi:hypothetical protein